MLSVLFVAGLALGRLAESQSPVVSFEGKSAGVVVDPRGYVVTCAHAVSGREHWLVKLKDGRLYIAKVVARDPAAELALVELDAGGRKFVPQRLAERPARVLDAVRVIGHPKSYEWTVTVGRVSAVGREIDIPGTGKVPGLLQVDASINPGCSGGAVLDRHGGMVGTPVAMHDGALGIGFVIPAKSVKAFLDKHLPEGGPR